MEKSLPNFLRALRKPAATLCLSAGLLALNADTVSAQCYALRLASNNMYLTAESTSLRVKAANNQPSQIFRFENVGQYKRITPHNSIYQGANALTRRWDNAVLPLFLYRGVDEQLWEQKNTGNGTVGFIQKGSNMGFGSTYNWGNGDPSAWSDINMVPAGDLDIYGANKWFLEDRTCPASSGTCDFNITLTTSNLNPQLNVPFTLTATCVGSGCSGVAYEWAAQGQESGIYGNPQTVEPPYTGVIDYTVIASKDASSCTYKSAHLRLNIQDGVTNPAFSQCIESENSNGNGSVTSDPNASNGSTRGDEFNYNKYVDYEVINVPVAGLYKVKLRYYASSQPSINVSVAVSGFSQTLQIPASNSWNIVWREETINVNLNAGTNTIRIQGVGGGSCRQDRICVTDPNSTARIGAGELAFQNESKQELQVFPNPSKGEFEVEFYLEKGEPADLTVTSIAGQTLQKRSVVGNGIHREKFNVANGAPGMYLFNVIKRDNIEVKKILINR